MSGLLLGTILGRPRARDHLDPRPRYSGGRAGGGLGGGARDVRQLWIHDAVQLPDAAGLGRVDLRTRRCSGPMDVAYRGTVIRARGTIGQ